MELVALSEFLDRHIIVYSEEKGSVKVREFNQTKASDEKSVSPNIIVTLSIIHTHIILLLFVFNYSHLHVHVQMYQLIQVHVEMFFRTIIGWIKIFFEKLMFNACELFLGFPFFLWAPHAGM